MAKRITRCPKCKTAFRVTDAHLNTAKGAVRCGSCLNIFVARDYLIRSTDDENVEKPGEKLKAQDKTAPSFLEKNTSQTAVKDKEKTNNIHEGSTSNHSTADESSITESENDTQKTSLSNSPSPSSNPNKGSDNNRDNNLISDNTSSSEDYSEFDENILFGNTNAPIENNLFEVSRLDSDQDDDLESETDESWALDLLNDTSSDDTQLAKIASPQKNTLLSNKNLYDELDLSPELSEFTSADDNRSEDSSSEGTGSEENDEFIDYDDDKEAEIDQKPSKETITGDKNTNNHDLNDEDYENLTHTGKFSTFELIGDEDETENEEISDEQYGVYPTGQNSNTYLNAIEPEAVEFSWKKRGSNLWNSSRMWFLFSVLAAIAAFLQLAYFKFDDLNRTSPYRSYYQLACNFIGCQLPGLVDLSKIKAANLVVRSHPEKQGMLLVDAILQNNAGYEQVFPALDLVFTDISNQPVAAKRFLPAEYLAGELAGRTVMPSNQPIHIALSIKDPGESAVSYQMSISQAKN